MVSLLCPYHFYFNPLAPCGARLLFIVHFTGVPQISIHSPRVGRDAPTACITTGRNLFQSTRPAWGETRKAARRKKKNFNPLAPRGARPFTRQMLSTIRKFQSTRPAWGETLLLLQSKGGDHISIHSPRVGRDHSGRARLPR